jgi:hypothetical protein
MKELQRCLKVLSTCREIYLTQNQLDDLFDHCVSVLTTFDIDKKTRLDQFETQKKKMDEEEIEIFYEQI